MAPRRHSSGCGMRNWQGFRVLDPRLRRRLLTRRRHCPSRLLSTNQARLGLIKIKIEPQHDRLDVGPFLRPNLGLHGECDFGGGGSSSHGARPLFFSRDCNSSGMKSTSRNHFAVVGPTRSAWKGAKPKKTGACVGAF
ncbi:hypothetical protein GGTG_07233 [Gaeumannomyces tritici R3-111a-1]|uniref:Uncharacterized protein n=1 Tax=Gaeumannomyces tritici (strain R3-111a-1) TaxID=644352 RepID=J3P136_GAET3|nr:hypothetical protein GGTG_07233 [Gaeumannomyces tritici R3-111a-1]EJT77321.1 hypothetical protein GGTG_07233 [Gaeumannomyces tritici R3-111a-1]